MTRKPRTWTDVINDPRVLSWDDQRPGGYLYVTLRRPWFNPNRDPWASPDRVRAHTVRDVINTLSACVERPGFWEEHGP